MNSTLTNESSNCETDLSFSSLPLNPSLLDNLVTLEFKEMTPIQAQSLPLILNSVDVIAQAETGSGKTVAFGLGLLNNLNVRWLQAQALILCPTRELAEQVSQVLRRLARFLPNVKILNLSGGVPMRAQTDSLRHGAHIVVGTPGRILKHLGKETLSLAHIQHLVLDEADRMLDMGFLDSLQQVLSHCPSKRQTLLFSATFSSQVKQLAQEFMRQPVEVKTDKVRPALAIEQIFFDVANQQAKYPLLRQLLSHYKPSATLIFCNTKEQSKELYTQLNQEGFSASLLNGDLEQAVRDQTIIQFVNQSCPIMVATDVAARGIDIKDLPMVINYDLAFEIETHIHRIGRTGRAGNKGIALSLSTHKDAERLCAIEESMNGGMIWEKAEKFAYVSSSKLIPSMITLRLMAGKKDKIRPGDILGALTKDAGLSVEAIGKIDISALHSFIAIERSQIKKAQDHFQHGKLKGKKVGVQRL